jgi:hypothetical protein
MGIWEDHELTDKVVDVLGRVPRNNSAPHLGRPFVSAYQLAIGLRQHYPGTVNAIGKPIGGEDIGRRDSLAQYVAQVLSTRINRDGTQFPVEGAFLSNANIRSVTFRDPTDGVDVTSSLVEAGFDMSLFRLREL